MSNLLYYVARLQKKMQMSAIKSCKIDSSSKIESGCQIVNVKMMKHSFCGNDCRIINCDIGSYCSIADRVIIGGARHPYEWVSTSPVFYLGRDSIKTKFAKHIRPLEQVTKIGNDVWIGENVMIKAGLNIGDGAVIGMGSIVTKDIPPFEIWAGNPAKKIRDRFNKDIIEAMMNMRWWEWTDDKLRENSRLFTTPETLIKELTR